MDCAYRKAFLDLFVNLGMDAKGFPRGLMWREIGRSILENSYDAERVKLVQELTSEASAAALNAVTAPSTAQAAIWRVRRQVVVRESAMQEALGRLRALLEEDKKKTTKRSGRIDRSSRARSLVRMAPDERFRARSWANDRSPIRERRVVTDDDSIPIREKRRSRIPSESGEESSIEILEDGAKW